MIPEEVREDAQAAGFKSVEELELASGETVWLLVPNDGAVVGLPVYLHYVNGLLTISTPKESRAILSDPSFVGDDE